MSNWIAVPLAIILFIGFIWFIDSRKNTKKAVTEAVGNVKDKTDEAKKQHVLRAGGQD